MNFFLLGPNTLLYTIATSWFFSLVLLALVDAEYKFLWVNVDVSESSSDTQIFNRSDLREKIKDGSLGLPPPDPLGDGGPDLHYFLLSDDAFVLTPYGW